MQDDDFQNHGPTRSTRTRRNVRVLSQEEQEEEDIALAIAASLSDSQNDEIVNNEAGDISQPGNPDEILSESDVDVEPNDASEESDFDAASDEDDADDEDDEDGEDEADWQANEEEDDPTGFGKPKRKNPKTKVGIPPKPKACALVARGKQNAARGLQKAPSTKSTMATVDVDKQDKAHSVQLPHTRAAANQRVVDCAAQNSPVASQLTSPADPVACPTAGSIASSNASAAVAAQGSVTAATEETRPGAQTSQLDQRATSTSAKTTSPKAPKPKTNNVKHVLLGCLHTHTIFVSVLQ